MKLSLASLLASALVLAACSISFLCLAPLADAAQLSFIAPANTVPLGTPFRIEVHLETQNDTLNAIQGAVMIPDGIRVTDVEAGNSFLQLWPAVPTYVPSEKRIVFIGGVPNGLPMQKDGLLFTLTAVATEDGAYQFDSDAVQAFLNDGKGTSEPLPPASITVNASGAASASGQISVPAAPTPDLTPPVFVSVGIGQYPGLFEGKYFATFYATDAESGVDYYEVKEGLFGSFVRANRYYVLKDQTLSTPLIIRAVDKAGNRVTWFVPPEHTSISLFVWTLVFGVVLLGLILFWVRRRRTCKAY